MNLATLVLPRVQTGLRWGLLALLAVVVLLGDPSAVFAAGDAAEGDEKMPSLFWHIVYSAGVIFGPMLFIISVSLVAIVVMLVLELKMPVCIPPGFVDEFTDTVNKRKFKEAFDMAKNDPSFLGRVLTAGMSRLQYGIEDAREAARNMQESIRSNKEQLNNYTAVVGTLGPLLGLVGTVFGMIQSFMVLAIPGKSLDPSKVAEGISHALVVTLLGIGLSVPAIFFNALFRNRIIRVSMDVGNIADDLLTQMYHNSKKPAPPPGAPGAPAPTAPMTAGAKPG
jgi:biopolymer transport protein ExbB